MPLHETTEQYYRNFVRDQIGGADAAMNHVLPPEILARESKAVEDGVISIIETAIAHCDQGTDAGLMLHPSELANQMLIWSIAGAALTHIADCSEAAMQKIAPYPPGGLPGLGGGPITPRGGI